MRFGKRQTRLNRSTQVRCCSDDYYTRLACAVVHSGIVTEDIAFLRGEWCAWLLDELGIGLTGTELLCAYKKRRGDRANGKR